MSKLLRRRPDHIGFSVPDIYAAASQWSLIFGAGPFFLSSDVQFDSLCFRGGPCEFHHSFAFGAWGELLIELQMIQACSPPELEQLLKPGPSPIMTHIGYISDVPEDDSRDLDADGHELYLRATRGPIDVRFHDARNSLGCSIEIHRRSGFLDASRARLREAANGWDGKDLLRE